MIRRLFAFVLLCWLLGFAWFSLLLPQPFETHRKTDGIVVLTGGAGRIGRGLDLLQAGAAKTMLISGVDRDVRPRELAVAERKSVVWGKSVSGRGDLGGRRIMKKKKQ